MPWEGSDRRSRLPADWPTLRRRILRRDGYRCQERLADGSLCDARATDVDHVIPGDDHSESNLRSLCSWHHRRKSSREGNAARGPVPTRTRAPERHPGALE